MIDQLLQSIANQQQGQTRPLQMLWCHGTDENGPVVPESDAPVDWSATIPLHRSEGFTGLPASLPFAVAVDEYASSPGKGYVVRIRANVEGEVVEMTDQDGPLNWTQRSFRLEMRHKYFDGSFSGHGWRVEVIGNEGPDMGVRSLYLHTQGGYTIGAAFTEQPSEVYPGVTVWAAETPAGQLTSEREEITFSTLYASIEETTATLGANDDVAVARYWIGLEGEQTLPGEGTPEWETGVNYSIGDVVTHQGSEYECIQAHTSQAGWEPPNVPALWSPV